MNAQQRDVIVFENLELNRAASILHEQQALRRLRRVRWRHWWNLVLRAIEPVELVRQVAPGVPPQRRHEWERHDHRPLY